MTHHITIGTTTMRMKDVERISSHANVTGTDPDKSCLYVNTQLIGQYDCKHGAEKAKEETLIKLRKQGFMKEPGMCANMISKIRNCCCCKCN